MVEQEVAGVVVLRLDRPRLQKDTGDQELIRRLEQLAMSRHEPKILINFAVCVQIDSFGMGQVIKGFERISAIGGRLALCNAKSQPRQMISLMVAGLIDYYDDEPKGLASFQKEQS